MATVKSSIKKQQDVLTPFIPVERLRLLLTTMQLQREKRPLPANAPFKKLRQSATGQTPGAEAFITGLGLHLKPEDKVTLGGNFDASQLSAMKRAGTVLIAPEPRNRPGHAKWVALQKKSAAKRFSVVFLALEASDEVEENELAEKAAGMPVIAVDGNDAVAVYRVAQESIAHARSGSGPTLIVGRIGEWHNDAGEYTDPILRMEAYLAAKGLSSVSSAELKQ
jgi:hypothetical protein